MATSPEQTDIVRHSHRSFSPSATIDDQLFRLNIGTILSAYLYGHMTEVHALRAIARAIRERRFELPSAAIDAHTK